jgi:hypothetical protein
MRRSLILFLLSALGVLSAMGTSGGGGGGGLEDLNPAAGLSCIFDNPALNFRTYTDAELNTLHVSNSQSTEALCEPKTAEIRGPGEYSVNNGTWLTGRTEIRPGQSVRVRLRSAETYETTIEATLVIGELTSGGFFNSLETSSGTFSVTTRRGRPADAPVVAILSPADQATVDAQSIVVQGTADDPDGIAEITVNGRLADTSDSFNTWQTDLPLETGANTITVASADTLLNRNPQAAVIEVENAAIVLQEPRAIATDSLNERLLVVDQGFRGVVSIDLRTDEATLLSPEDAGTPFIEPQRIVLSAARERAWVIDEGYEDLIEIDLATGARSLLTGPGDPIPEARNMAVDEARDRILVLRTIFSTNNDDTQIYAVDMATGARTVLSDNETPDTENPFNFATAIVFDEAGDQLLVLQRSSSALTVDPDLGTRSVFVDDSGGNVVSAVNDPVAARALLADRFSSMIKELPLVGGEIESLWSTGGTPAQIALDRLNNRLLVDSLGGDDIVAIDLDTGELSIAY